MKDRTCYRTSGRVGIKTERRPEYTHCTQLCNFHAVVLGKRIEDEESKYNVWSLPVTVNIVYNTHLSQCSWAWRSCTATELREGWWWQATLTVTLLTETASKQRRCLEQDNHSIKRLQFVLWVYDNENYDNLWNQNENDIKWKLQQAKRMKTRTIVQTKKRKQNIWQNHTAIYCANLTWHSNVNVNRLLGLSYSTENIGIIWCSSGVGRRLCGVYNNYEL